MQLRRGTPSSAFRETGLPKAGWSGKRTILENESAALVSQFRPESLAPSALLIITLQVPQSGSRWIPLSRAPI